MSSNKSKFFIFTITILTLVISLLGTSESYSQLRVDDRLEFYNVIKGDSFNSIFNDFDLHPIQNFFLKIYLKKNKLQVAQAGHYYLKNKSWKEFLNSVSNGDVVIFKFEIPSGKNLYEVKKIISESNFKNDCDNFDCLDNQFNFVEGTLKPDTYFYKHSSSLARTLQKSQTDFFQLATNLWINKNPQSPIRNLSDAIILASIVEKEAGNEDEKPIIAGVFLHRISIGMKLQADPTIIYGLLPNFNGDITKAN